MMESPEHTRGLRGWSSRMAKYGRGAGVVSAAGVATVLAALALPVPPPEPERIQGPQGIPDGLAPRAQAPQDLRVFLESRRWGEESLQDVQQRTATGEAAAAKRRDVDEIGLVGLTTIQERRVSLIRFPDGAVARFMPGDKLPDGRTLKVATETTLTLEGTEDGQTKVLDLFPPIPAELRLAAPEAETPGLPVASDATPAS